MMFILAALHFILMYHLNRRFLSRCPPKYLTWVYLSMVSPMMFIDECWYFASCWLLPKYTSSVFDSLSLSLTACIQNFISCIESSMIVMMLSSSDMFPLFVWFGMNGLLSEWSSASLIFSHILYCKCISYKEKCTLYWSLWYAGFHDLSPEYSLFMATLNLYGFRYFLYQFSASFPIPNILLSTIRSRSWSKVTNATNKFNIITGVISCISIM